MNDAEKSREQFSGEAAGLRRRVEKLEASEAELQFALLKEEIVARVRDEIWDMKGSGDMERVLSAVQQGLARLGVPFDHCGVNIVEERSAPPSVAFHSMSPEGRWIKLGTEQGAEAVLRIWREQEVAYRRDLQAEDPRGEAGYLREIFKDPIRSVVDVPFPQGTLALNSTRPHAFSARDLELVREIAQVLSAGFSRMESLHTLECCNRDLESEIAEHRKVEKALRASERRFRAVAHSATDAIIVADCGGRILSWNQGAQALFGYREEEVLHKALTLLMPASYRETHQRGVERLGSGGESRIVGRVVELMGLRKDGREFPLELSLASWKAGGERFYSGIIRDLTERKRTEEERVRLERLRALGELSAGVAHNLNNILVGVLGYAEFIRQKVRDPEIGADVEQIIASARRARDLVRRLRHAVSSAEEGILEPVPVNEVVRQAVQELRSRWLAKAGGIAIEVVEDLEEVPPIRGVSSGLHDLLLSLLSNAVEALCEDGTITIATRALETGVQLSVCDTGKGMDKEIRRRVFEPFFTTKMDVGSGLGLSEVYAMVTRWGGGIEVESEPGEGATFTLRFAAWTEVDGQEKEERSEACREEQGRVLIVEDEEVVGALLSRLLGADHEVEVLRSGREALDRLEPGRYDVVLIDLDMAGMSGNEVARQMRRADPSLATVLITGSESRAGKERMAPFDFRLQKPFDDMDQIQYVVVQALALHRIRTEERD